MLDHVTFAALTAECIVVVSRRSVSTDKTQFFSVWSLSCCVWLCCRFTAADEVVGCTVDMPPVVRQYCGAWGRRWHLIGGVTAGGVGVRCVGRRVDERVRRWCCAVMNVMVWSPHHRRAALALHSLPPPAAAAVSSSSSLTLQPCQLHH